jgi:alkyl hydroperoxide reductase subunit F
VLVVGGGPAGAAAAIYAARKGIRTGVAAERFGGQVLDTMAIENFISVQETEGPKLASALEEHVKYDVDIMNLQRASKLIPAKMPVSCTKSASPAVRRSSQDRDPGDRRPLA